MRVSFRGVMSGGTDPHGPTRTHPEDPVDLLLYHPMAKWRLARPTRCAGAVFGPKGGMSTNCGPDR
jgi:hypothetical protein